LLAFSDDKFIKETRLDITSSKKLLKVKNKNYPTNRKRVNANSNLILTDYLKEA
jgi:hypothetical protein